MRSPSDELVNERAEREQIIRCRRILCRWREVSEEDAPLRIEQNVARREVPVCAPGFLLQFRERTEDSCDNFAQQRAVHFAPRLEELREARLVTRGRVERKARLVAVECKNRRESAAPCDDGRLLFRRGAEERMAMGPLRRARPADDDQCGTAIIDRSGGKERGAPAPADRLVQLVFTARLHASSGNPQPVRARSALFFSERAALPTSRTSRRCLLRKCRRAIRR